MATTNFHLKKSTPFPWRTRLLHATIITLLVLGVIFMFIPLVWVILSSLKMESEFLAYPVKILPKVWQWVNYVKAFTVAPFTRYFMNSVFLATLSSTLVVASSSTIAYAFARLNAPGKKFLFSINIVLLMLPWAVMGIPQYIIYTKLGLTNSYWPWIIGGLTGSAWHIFLFRQFFMNFPTEIEEAAELDGCSRFQIFLKIVLPNSLPVVVTSFIFNFSWVWGDWVSPLLYLGEKQMPLAVALAGQFYVDPQTNRIITLTMAAVVMYMLPLVVMFFALQRYILEGVVTSGLKG